MARKKKQGASPQRKRRASEQLPLFDEDFAPADQEEEELADIEPIFDRRLMEKVMRDAIADLKAGRNPFGEGMLLPESLAELFSGVADADAADSGDPALEEAQELVYQALEAPPRKKAALARKALSISPDCADAYVLLAEDADSPEQALDLYDQAIAAGRRVLGAEYFAEYAGYFWGLLETRPFMRALEGKSHVLRILRRDDEAGEVLREMLRLNPNDNQGVRYSLTALLLEGHRDAEAAALLDEGKEEDSAFFACARALLAFRAEGDSPRARDLLWKMRERNETLPACLIGREELPPGPLPFYSPGEPSEAHWITEELLPSFRDTPGAIPWVRRTLGVGWSLPDGPRRSPWKHARGILKDLPLAVEEHWQVDLLALPSPEKGSSQWWLVVVSSEHRSPLVVGGAEERPADADVREELIQTMLHPAEGDPRRPALIEVRRKTLHQQLHKKLKEIDVECRLAEALDRIEPLVPTLQRASDFLGQHAGQSVAPEQLESLPQAVGSRWLLGVKLLATWITSEDREPYRPLAVVVVDAEEGLVRLHSLVRAPLELESAWHTLSNAMAHPLAGEPERPEELVIVGVEPGLVDALASRLDEAGVRSCTAAEDEHITSLFESLEEDLADKRQHGVAMTRAPGVGPEELQGFFKAAADYFRKKPWRMIPSDEMIRIRSDDFQSGTWYAVVIGQSGMVRGLALYEGDALIRKMLSGELSERQTLRQTSGISVMYNEAFELHPLDLAAIERHDWPVAAPEAYPVALRINPGMSIRPLLSWELRLVEACLRAVPELLQSRQASLEILVPAAGGAVALRLARD